MFGGKPAKKTPSVFGSALFVILLLSSFVTLVRLSSGESNSYKGIKEDDRVYVDNANSYISASPHTLQSDGYIYLNVTSKEFGGAVDFCFGFDSNLAYPKSLELYDPHVVSTSHELNLTSYLNSPECRVDYNYTRNEGKTVYDGYFVVNFNATIFEDVTVNATSLGINNQTGDVIKGKRAVGWEWQKLFSEHFDVGNLESGMFYWKTTETLNWTTLNGNLNSLEEERFSFMGANSWYFANASVEKGKAYFLRVWLTLVPTLDDVTHEFFVGLKPHGKSIAQANDAGQFCCLDPWFNDAWLYRKSHVINPAPGAGTNYQVKIVVYNMAGADSGDRVFIVSCSPDFHDIRFTGSDGSTLLDYYMETPAYNVAVFWVKIPYDLSSSSQTIYLYYGNSDPNCVTASNGTNTFEFFDDFSGSSLDSSKWNSNAGGGTITVSNGELHVNKPSAYGTYPTVYSTSTRSVLNHSYVARIWDWYTSMYTYIGLTLRNPLTDVPASNRYSSALYGIHYEEEWQMYMLDYLSYLDTDGGTYDYGSGQMYDQQLIRYTLDHGVSCNKWSFGMPGYDVLTSSYSAKSFSASDTVYLLFGVMANGLAGTLNYGENVDWVLERKFVNPEPAHGAWGQQEGTPPPVPWFDCNWHYRKSHIINAANGAGTNYQVKINVHYLSGADNGANVYLNGKCKGGFGDIRFTDNDGVTLLSYWMEMPCSDTATFWVKVQDNLDSSPATVYIYYGNTAASSTSSGAGTFDFFDDFSSSPNGWTLSGATISCGTLNLQSGQANYAQKARPSGYDNYRFRFRAATAAGDQYWQAYPRGSGVYPDANPRYVVGNYYYSPLSSVRYITQGGVQLPILNPVRDEGGHVLQVLKSGSSYTDTWDDALSSSATDSTAETGGLIAFSTAWANRQVQIEWGFLAKYVNPEPTPGSWGAVEGSGSAAPSPFTFVIWGSQSYGDPVDLSGGYPELVSSKSVCDDIYTLAANTGRYGYCSNYWGFETQPSYVYATAQYCEAEYTRSAIFYKGHSFDFYPNQDPTDPLWCTQKHYANYDSEGRYQVYSDYIKDYHIGENIYLGKTAAGKASGTHDFVFLWTCGYGNEERVGGSHSDHTYGMLASWMDIANPNTALSHDGYNSPDSTGKCFIGFDWLSRWFTTSTQNPSYNYANFTSRFFYYALQPGMSINYGLSQAALSTTGYSFNECELFRTSGYQIWNGTQNVTSRMRVWGDGGYVLR